MGTGVVAFNLAPKHALLCDTNPHLVGFYQSIADGHITAEVVRDFLNREGAILKKENRITMEFVMGSTPIMLHWIFYS